MSNLELNKGDQFIFGVDVSASMQTRDCEGGMSRIEYLKEKLGVFAEEASKYDPDGIDLITFGQTCKVYSNVTAENAKGIIKPLDAREAATMTDQLITKAYAMHTKSGAEQTVLFIATDGEPSDEGAVMEAIRGIAAKLKDEHEFAISFLTVGKPSDRLVEFLNKLDDDLSAKYDIVDVKALADVDFLTAFSGALHD